MILDASQEAAVSMTCAARIGITTGGPGTGKTTCLHSALDRLDKMGVSYELAAPTGKASKRMNEATGRPAQTIHRLLEYSPKEGGFLRNGGNVLETQLVVVDESSMVDVELAAALLDAINSRCTRLILIGDADQLPPVGPGRVFGDLVDSASVPVSRLTTVHRTAMESWVYRNAPKVLAGQVPDLNRCNDFRFFEVEESSAIVPMLERLVVEYMPQLNADPQVLIPQKTGKAGVIAANAALQQALNPRSKGAKYFKNGDIEIRIGDRVLQTKNDYDLGVFNGEIGEVESIDASGLVVDYHDKPPVFYTLAQASALRLAYALTVHKSQGSEWPWVIFVCHSTHTKMLTRPLLYTAITRAKKGVILVGDRKGLKAATAARQPARRHTALIERLHGEI